MPFQRTWTDEQKRRLRALYPTHPTEEVARELGHSVYGVQGMASELGVSKRGRLWSDRDKARLVKIYPTTPTEEIVRRLGRPASGIYRMAFLMRIGKWGADPHTRKLWSAAGRKGSAARWRDRLWSDADKARLVEMYPLHPGKEVARTLGRTLVSVRGMAARLGLNRAAARAAGGAA